VGDFHRKADIFCPLSGFLMVCVGGGEKIMKPADSTASENAVGKLSKRVQEASDELQFISTPKPK
jgi:hypothetical protein